MVDVLVESRGMAIWDTHSVRKVGNADMEVDLMVGEMREVG